MTDERFCCASRARLRIGSRCAGGDRSHCLALPLLRACDHVAQHCAPTLARRRARHQRRRRASAADGRAAAGGRAWSRGWKSGGREWGRLLRRHCLCASATSRRWAWAAKRRPLRLLQQPHSPQPRAHRVWVWLSSRVTMQIGPGLAMAAPLHLPAVLDSHAPPAHPLSEGRSGACRRHRRRWRPRRLCCRCRWPVAAVTAVAVRSVRTRVRCVRFCPCRCFLSVPAHRPMAQRDRRLRLVRRTTTRSAAGPGARLRWLLHDCCCFHLRLHFPLLLPLQPHVSRCAVRACLLWLVCVADGAAAALVWLCALRWFVAAAQPRRSLCAARTAHHTRKHEHTSVQGQRRDKEGGDAWRRSDTATVRYRSADGRRSDSQRRGKCAARTATTGAVDAASPSHSQREACRRSETWEISCKQCAFECSALHCADRNRRPLAVAAAAVSLPPPTAAPPPPTSLASPTHSPSPWASPSAASA